MLATPLDAMLTELFPAPRSISPVILALSVIFKTSSPIPVNTPPSRLPVPWLIVMSPVAVVVSIAAVAPEIIPLLVIVPL